MNKLTITVCMTIGTILGGLVPALFGDSSLFDGWSILGSVIGGILGIWVGAKVNKLLF